MTKLHPRLTLTLQRRATPPWPIRFRNAGAAAPITITRAREPGPARLSCGNLARRARLAFAAVSSDGAHHEQAHASAVGRGQRLARRARFGACRGGGPSAHLR